MSPKERGYQYNATAFGIMDQLTYHYDGGNKLLKVQDAAGSEGFKDGANTGNDYTYDNNGNMTSDANKGISNITYNHLNLPVTITFPTGSITYTYDATGVKQEKLVYESGQVSARETQYAGNYHYKRFGRQPPTLQFFSQPEGYVTYNAGIFSYIYQYKDHLGNNRLSYGDSNGDGQVTGTEILEEDNYYCFGMKHKGEGYNNIINGVEHKYKFNGKELQEEFGLNVTAMDYRQYDHVLGRFNSIDALAETSYSTTPYHFAYNNPNYWSDPTGLISQSAIDAMWNNSANNAATKWINNGGGNFDSSSGNGWVNADSGTFNQYSESLPEVTIYDGIGTSRDKSNNGIIEGHLYWKGKYYQSFRDDQFTGQLNDIQSSFDGLGAADPTGIVDGLNALGYLARGQNANAAIAAMGIIPYIGDLAKVGKYGKKSYSVYHGLDASGAVNYVGITSRNPATRFAEHLNSLGTGKEFLRYRTIEGATGLTKQQARVLEQTLINTYGLQKNGGTLLNKINSISPTNWAKYSINP